MTTLGPAITLLWISGVIAASALAAQLSVIMIGWPQPGELKKMARRLGVTLAGFPGDVAAGLGNVAEWVLYGDRP